MSNETPPPKRPYNKKEVFLSEEDFAGCIDLYALAPLS
jgi:hypothetical protein